MITSSPFIGYSSVCVSVLCVRVCGWVRVLGCVCVRVRVLGCVCACVLNKQNALLLGQEM